MDITFMENWIATVQCARIPYPIHIVSNPGTRGIAIFMTILQQVFPYSVVASVHATATYCGPSTVYVV